MKGQILDREIKVRLAGPADIHRVASLLPQGLNHPVNTKYLIAEKSGTAEILGGAYYRINPTANGMRVASLLLSVHPETLMVETATTLLTACLSAAGIAGVGGAVYDAMVTAGSPVETLLLKAGFVPIQTLIDYEINLRAALNVLDRTMRHMKRRGKLPADTSVIPLDEAPITSVNALVSRYLGGSVDAFAGAVLTDISSVAKVGPKIVGVTVVINKGNGADVPYTVTDPAYRNGWVTPAMWQRTAGELINAQHKDISYCTNSQQFKSMFNFSRRLGSKETGRQLRYARSFS